MHLLNALRNFVFAKIIKTIPFLRKFLRNHSIFAKIILIYAKPANVLYAFNAFNASICSCLAHIFVKTFAGMIFAKSFAKERNPKPNATTTSNNFCPLWTKWPTSTCFRRVRSRDCRPHLDQEQNTGHNLQPSLTSFAYPKNFLPRKRTWCKNSKPLVTYLFKLLIGRADLINECLLKYTWLFLCCLDLLKDLSSELDMDGIRFIR